ncbi:hypothetical protein [Caniella muris]|uniref:hypothetical protein n=1 Tax=Caniella muris TaxID=2941502 RepID=UPI00203EC308|nr:hypothetical protein [Caniella muris]
MIMARTATGTTPQGALAPAIGKIRSLVPFRGRGRKGDGDAGVDDRIAGDAALMALKPSWGYVFRSDHFEVDDRVGCVLEFGVRKGVTDGLGCFWGLRRTPRGLPDGVSVTVVDTVERKGENWVADALTRSEGMGNLDMNAQNQAGTAVTRHKASVRKHQLTQIAREINNGASYVCDHMRMLVHAPDLETLDRAIECLRRYYTEGLAGVFLGSYMGCQREELAGLFLAGPRRLGRGHHFTSTEFAGSYPLVTHGLEDPAGEYVGFMAGDVNNSAVLCDIDRYERSVVVCSETRPAKGYDGASVGRVWGAALVHAALADGHRVVHLKLDPFDESPLHPAGLSECRIDLNSGDVNMFEVFGDPSQQQAAFAGNIRKIVLMADLAYSEAADESDVVVREKLAELLTAFYVDRNMWDPGSGSARPRKGVVGVAHDQVPRLSEFISYVTEAYNSERAAGGTDAHLLSSLNQIRLTLTNLVNNNGDLFDTRTSSSVDSVAGAPRVVYDFSILERRGRNIALAQFVNVVSYAVQSLGPGDLCVVTGAERISESVWDYVSTCFTSLYERGGRTALCYSSFDSLFDDHRHNRFDSADYTLFGTMTHDEQARYQEIVDTKVPKDLSDLVTGRSPDLAYLRRGFENVCFHLDVPLRPRG